jgi:hypothetical protein
MQLPAFPPGSTHAAVPQLLCWLLQPMHSACCLQRAGDSCQHGCVPLLLGDPYSRALCMLPAKHAVGLSQHTTAMLFCWLRARPAARAPSPWSRPSVFSRSETWPQHCLLGQALRHENAVQACRHSSVSGDVNRRIIGTTCVGRTRPNMQGSARAVLRILNSCMQDAVVRVHCRSPYTWTQLCSVCNYIQL